ncbi:MAG: TlpA family protein disulfide reductase [Bacteroidetes bacterium]|nr:TlpA family protein disulfide reductase [Bacteroidota bacterium]
MKFIQIFFFFLLTSILGYSQNIPVVKFNDLEKRIKNASDTTYVVNFWATWCIPCIKELPDFDSINESYRNNKVKVLLVSIDFKEDLKTKVLPFINTRKIKSEIILLDELNGNYFIPKVSEQWTGAIPATLLINNQKLVKHFFEKKLNYEMLKTEIDSIELKK